MSHLGKHSALDPCGSFGHISPTLSPFSNFAYLSLFTPLYNLAATSLKASFGSILAMKACDRGRILGQPSAQISKLWFTHFLRPLTPFWNFANLSLFTPLYNLAPSSKGRFLYIPQATNSHQMTLGDLRMYQINRTASPFHNIQIDDISLYRQFDPLYTISNWHHMANSSKYWHSNGFPCPTGTWVLIELDMDQFGVGVQASWHLGGVLPH